MTMLTLTVARITAALASSLLHLASWMLARTLNMPEPLVHDTGVFVIARVQAVESKVGKALCPLRLVRRLRAWLEN